MRFQHPSLCDPKNMMMKLAEEAGFCYSIDMIIFAVQTNVELTNKPDWLDSFRSRHNAKRYDYHVTLKQVCVIEQHQIPIIKNLLSEYFEKEQLRAIPVRFNELNLADSKKEAGEAYIMINSETNEIINKLQKDIVDVLSDFNNYFWPDSKQYEERFIPHITIAMDLDAESFERAKEDLKDDYQCEGIITKVILSVVHNFDPQDKTKSYHEDSIYNLV